MAQAVRRTAFECSWCVLAHAIVRQGNISLVLTSCKEEINTYIFSPFLLKVEYICKKRAAVSWSGGDFKTGTHGKMFLPCESTSRHGVVPIGVNDLCGRSGRRRKEGGGVDLPEYSRENSHSPLIPHLWVCKPSLLSPW